MNSLLRTAIVHYSFHRHHAGQERSCYTFAGSFLEIGLSSSDRARPTDFRVVGVVRRSTLVVTDSISPSLMFSCAVAQGRLLERINPW